MSCASWRNIRWMSRSSSLIACRVEGVIGAAMISLRDEGSQNTGKRAAVILNITAGDVLSSDVAEDAPNNISPAVQEVGRDVSANLLSDSAVYPSQSTLRKFVYKRALRCFGEVVRPKGGKGGPRHIGKEMLFQKGDIWRGGLAQGGEASREVPVANC